MPTLPWWLWQPALAYLAILFVAGFCFGRRFRYAAIAQVLILAPFILWWVLA